MSPRSRRSRLAVARVYSLAGLLLLHCSIGENGQSTGPSLLSGDGDAFPHETSELDIGGIDGKRNPEDEGLNSLCGVGSCLPDDPSACEAPEPPAGDAGGAGGAGGASGAEMGGAAGSVSFDPGDLLEVGEACRVAIAIDCVGEECEVQRACAPSGASEDGEPCIASKDCQAGLACVGEGNSGICRPYCCEGTALSCSSGAFCDKRSLPESPGVYVPVCVPTDNCSLTEIFPCTEGQECSCQGDRACVVVRPDGATACTIPGAGQLGDACTGKEGAECAHGFVCSPSAGCMKLCSTVAEVSDCPMEGTCQSPSEFPSDLGVCVGTSTGIPVTR